MLKSDIMKTVTQDHMFEFQRIRWERVKEAGVDRLLLTLIEAESAGGECPHCRKPWKKIEVRNQFASFDYYDPDCHCYERCEKCGMSLHGVTFPNRAPGPYKCPRCSYPGEEQWILLCYQCGQRSTQHVGKYVPWKCPECSGRSRSKKSKELQL